MKALLTKYSDTEQAHIVLIPETPFERKIIEDGNIGAIKLYTKDLSTAQFPDKCIRISEPLEDEKHYFIGELTSDWLVR